MEYSIYIKFSKSVQYELKRHTCIVKSMKLSKNEIYQFCVTTVNGPEPCVPEKSTIILSSGKQVTEMVRPLNPSTQEPWLPALIPILFLEKFLLCECSL